MSVYNKPYIWEYSYNYPNKSILIYDWEIRKTNRFKFMQGVSLPTKMQGHFETEQAPSSYDLIFESHVPLENLMKWDALMTSAQLYLINQKIIDLLNEICPDDFQVFPTLIHNANKKTTEFECRDYFLLNITQLDDLIDHERSDKKLLDDGNFYGFRKLVLKNSIKFHLSRLKDFNDIILTSPQLVSAFRKAKIKGVKFIKDEEYGIY